MKPQPKHQPLFFTPRTPWGARLPGRSFFDHLKASDAVPMTGPDDKRPLSGKELQGLGGGMAPNQLGGHPVQAGGAGNDAWKVRHIDPQNYQIPQQPKALRPEAKAQTFAEWVRSQYYRQPREMTEEEKNYYRGAMTIQPKEKGVLGRALSHFYAEAGYGGSHPGTGEIPEKYLGIGFSTNPNMRTEMPFSEPNAAATPNVYPKGGEKDLENWKYANPDRAFNPENEGEEAAAPEELIPSLPMPQSLSRNAWQPPKTLKPTVPASQYPR